MRPETTLETLVAKDEITEALAAYCRAVDRLDMELGRTVFHEDAVADYGAMYQGTGHGFMEFVRAAHLTMQTHGHHIGGITIRVDGDHAGSECYVIVRLRMASPDGALTDIVSHGRYVDRWERRADGAWRIAHRRYLHTMDERHAVEGASFPTTGSRDRDDPSYAVLRGASAFIPVEVADIDAAWLEAVLQSHAPGAKLDGIEIAEAHSGTTGRVRVLLKHGDVRLPKSVFVKLPPFDEAQRKFVEAQGMGRAEVRFYAELAHEVPVRVPRPFHASHGDQERYVMVLEDLQALGARYPGANDPHLASFVERTIDAFASLHAAFWGSPRFAEGGDLAWVEERSRSYGSAAPLVTFAVEQLGEKLPEASRALAEAYVPRAERIPALLGEGTPTLIHGDAHIGNMFALGDSPGFLDWAMVSSAPGLRDVAYFLGGSVGTELRRARERELVARYCEQLHARGAAIDADVAWQQYRLNLLTAWIAALVTAAMGSHWQPIEIGMAATRRADAAIADHDVAALLRERLP